jgi:hypothetical protein
MEMVWGSGKWINVHQTDRGGGEEDHRSNARVRRMCRKSEADRQIGAAPSGTQGKWPSFSISHGNHCISSDWPLTPLPPNPLVPLSRDGLASRKLRRHDWYHPLSQPLKVLLRYAKLHHSTSSEYLLPSLPSFLPLPFFK